MTMKAGYFINPNTGEPIYQQLTRQLKHSISTGSLKPGDRLPTVRELAENLVVNPNTVARSYRELIAEGLLEGTQGSGTFVTASLPRVKPQERERRLQPFVDQLISEAALLGVHGNDLVKLIQQRIRERKEGDHDNNNSSHEILR
jgi:GntR family transcriptional regulator